MRRSLPSVGLCYVSGGFGTLNAAFLHQIRNRTRISFANCCSPNKNSAYCSQIINFILGRPSLSLLFVECNGIIIRCINNFCIDAYRRIVCAHLVINVFNKFRNHLIHLLLQLFPLLPIGTILKKDFIFCICAVIVPKQIGTIIAYRFRHRKNTAFLQSVCVHTLNMLNNCFYHRIIKHLLSGCQTIAIKVLRGSFKNPIKFFWLIFFPEDILPHLPFSRFLRDKLIQKFSRSSCK